jgi:hypothetical protein
VIQLALETALHVQFDATVTPTVRVPAVEETVCADGESVAAQAFNALCCVTVTVTPAAVNVPDRGRPPGGVAAALTVTVPLPAPLDPPVTVSHGEVVVDAQAQSEPVLTVADTF